MWTDWWLQFSGECEYCLVAREDYAIYRDNSLAFERSGDRGLFFEKLLFSVNERVDVVGRELEAMTVRDGIGWASFHAITAKNAA